MMDAQLPEDIDIEFEGQFKRTPEGDYLFTGPVTISWRTTVFQADRLTLRGDRYIEAEGNVLIAWDGNRIFGSRATYDLQEERGVFEDAAGQVRSDYLFWAKRVEKIGAETIRLKHARVTTCTQPVPYWSFAVTSATITINQYARMWNARPRASKIPFFYLPYLIWPVKTDRAVGLLFPDFQSTQNRGSAYSQELFIPLGQSADLTLLGRYYTEAGFGGGGEFRFVPNERGAGTLNGFYIRDQVAASEGKPEDRFRVSFLQSQEFVNGFRMVADMNFVSDFDYYSDFERDLDLITSPTILTRLEFSRNDSWTSLNVRELRREQFLQVRPAGVPIDGELVQQTLPEIEWRGRSRQLGKTPLYLTFQSSFSGIQQREKNQLQGTTFDADYLRGDLFPEISLPLTRFSWIDITPLLRYRYTYYSQHQVREGPLNERRLVDESLIRSLWGGGIDIIGPKFGRIFNRGDNPYATKYRHMIEPRIIYSFNEEFDGVDEIIPFDEVDAYRGGGNAVTYSISNRLAVKRPRVKPDSDPTPEPAPFLKDRQASDLGLDQEAPILPDVVTPEYDDTAPQEPVEIATLELRQTRFFDREREKAGSEDTTPYSALSLIGRYNPSPTMSLDFRASYDPLYDQITNVTFSGGLQAALARLRFSFVHSAGLTALAEDSNQMRITTGLTFFNGKLQLDLDGSLNFNPQENQATVPDRRVRLNYKTQCCTVIVEHLDRSFSQTQRNDWYFRVDFHGIGKIFNVSY